jgi:hypothetical protein
LTLVNICVKIYLVNIFTKGFILKILTNLFNNIISFFPNVPPENGGILGGTQNIITEYYHDSSTQKNIIAEYIPNILVLNTQIRTWQKNGIEFYGLIHSHPQSEETLSSADIDYIIDIMKSIPYTEFSLYFPILIPHKTIIPYIVTKKDHNITILKDTLQLI